MANDASTGAEGRQEAMVIESVDESSPRNVDAKESRATTVPPSYSKLSHAGQCDK